MVFAHPDGGSPLEVTVLKLREIMTKDVFTLTPDMSLREAVELFAERHVSGAPVVDGTKVVGVLTAADLLTFSASTMGVPSGPGTAAEEAEWEEEADVPTEEWDDAPAGSFFTEFWDDAGSDTTERIETVRGPEWDLLGEHEVSEAMTRRVRALGPDVEVSRAAQVMSKAGMHRVLVMERGRLVGVVSAMDVTRAVAEGKLVRRTYVFNDTADFDDRR